MPDTPFSSEKDDILCSCKCQPTPLHEPFVVVQTHGECSTPESIARLTMKSTRRLDSMDGHVHGFTDKKMEIVQVRNALFVCATRWRESQRTLWIKTAVIDVLGAREPRQRSNYPCRRASPAWMRQTTHNQNIRPTLISCSFRTFPQGFVHGQEATKDLVHVAHSTERELHLRKKVA